MGLEILTCFYCGTYFYSDNPDIDETIRVGPDSNRIGCRNDWCQETRHPQPVKKYRKKPVVVEVEGPIQIERQIHTLEGKMTASVGDCVITGVNGEKYPCKPDIFDKTYELAEEE